jgi:ubiquinone/menaquinone biosynthesis C-methylase UbiE
LYSLRISLFVVDHQRQLTVNHNDHVALLRGGIPISDATTSTHPIWADFGSGHGAFTLALADLLGSNAEIYSIDRDSGALRDQQRTMTAQFPAVTVHYQTADFTQPLTLPPLDGIVMANSLHFVPPRAKPSVLALVKRYLRPGGRLLLVEYNTDHGNTWVPHPMSYSTWEALARENGFTHTHRLAAVPSRFLGEIFSAVSW